MREFAFSDNVLMVRHLSLLALTAALTFAGGCHAPELAIFQEQQKMFASDGSDSSGDLETLSLIHISEPTRPY